MAGLSAFLPSSSFPVPVLPAPTFPTLTFPPDSPALKAAFAHKSLLPAIAVHPTAYLLPQRWTRWCYRLAHCPLRRLLLEDRKGAAMRRGEKDSDPRSEDGRGKQEYVEIPAN